MADPVRSRRARALSVLVMATGVLVAIVGLLLTLAGSRSPEVLPETSAPEVLGEQAFAGSNAQTEQELPTSVNAGAAGTVASSPADASGATTLLGLLLVLLGAVTARLGWIRARG